MDEISQLITRKETEQQKLLTFLNDLKSIGKFDPTHLKICNFGISSKV